MPPKDEILVGRAIRAIRQRLTSLQQCGVTHVARRLTMVPDSLSSAAATDHGYMVPGSSSSASPGTDTAEQASSGTQKLVPPVPLDPALGDRQAALAQVACRVASCTRCEELARTRTQTVFGTGDPHSAADVHRRGPRRGRRPPGRALRGPGRTASDRHHRQGDEAPPRGRVYHEHPPLPAAVESHAVTRRDRALP